MANRWRFLFLYGCFVMLAVTSSASAGIYKRLVDAGAFNTDEMALTLRERTDNQPYAWMSDAVVDAGAVSHSADISICLTTVEGLPKGAPDRPLWLQVDVFHLNRHEWVPAAVLDISAGQETVSVEIPMPAFKPDPEEGFDLVPVRLDLRDNPSAPDLAWRSLHTLARAQSGASKPRASVFDYDKTVSSACSDYFFEPIWHLLRRIQEEGGVAFYVTASKSFRIPNLRHNLVMAGLPPGPILSSRLPIPQGVDYQLLFKAKNEKVVHMKSIASLFDIRFACGDSEDDIDAYQQMRIPEIYHIVWQKDAQEPEIEPCYGAGKSLYMISNEVEILSYRLDPSRDASIQDGPQVQVHHATACSDAPVVRKAQKLLPLPPEPFLPKSHWMNVRKFPMEAAGKYPEYLTGNLKQRYVEIAGRALSAKKL